MAAPGLRLFSLTALGVLAACTSTPRPEREAEPLRFATSRDSAVELELPTEDDVGFQFVVFGDRTGGPESGIATLRQAVADTNLLAPDLVMTVGDLIQGYSGVKPWMSQMRRFRGIMGTLAMPWFPVAGNHDIYWRGPNKPAEEHEVRYEEHFGPLWYAFEHHDSWFIVLYSDEPNPETGERNFRKPECQRMSAEQHAWLDQTLANAADAKNVFVFVHHPRWLARYGDDWEKVHGSLAAAGNVRAVFAGHIHEMRYDGVRDGIEYFALATVGGHQWGEVPRAGFLHEYHVVTVRGEELTVAAIPVGEILDARQVTGDVSEAARAFERNFSPKVTGSTEFAADFGATDTFDLTLINPIEFPLECTVTPVSTDPRWRFDPEHLHVKLAASAGSADDPQAVTQTVVSQETVTLRATHPTCQTADQALGPIQFRIDSEVIHGGLRIPLTSLRRTLTAGGDGWQTPAPNEPTKHAGRDRGGLNLDGRNDWIEVPRPSEPSTGLPAGEFEAWELAIEILPHRRAIRTPVTLVQSRESAHGSIRIGLEPPGTVIAQLKRDGKTVTRRAKGVLLETERPDAQSDYLRVAVRVLDGHFELSVGGPNVPTVSSKSSMPTGSHGNPHDLLPLALGARVRATHPAGGRIEVEQPFQGRVRNFHFRNLDAGSATPSAEAPNSNAAAAALTAPLNIQLPLEAVGAGQAIGTWTVDVGGGVAAIHGVQHGGIQTPN